MTTKASEKAELDLGSKILFYCCIACTSIFGVVAVVLALMEFNQGDLPPAGGLLTLGLVVLGTAYYMTRELR